MIYRKKHNSQSADGFTLLELLVVIVIIGVISAVAAPGWLGFLNRQRMNAARADLISVLRNAQQESQSRQISKQVNFSTTDLSVTVRNTSDTTGGIVTSLAEGSATDNYDLELTEEFLIFDHDGRVDEETTLPFFIKITNEDSSAQSCVIVTTLLGGLKSANDDLCDNFDAN